VAQKTKKIFLHTTIILGSLLVLSIVVFVYHKAEQAKADQFLPSDLNQDGIVDAKDIDLIKNNYANTAGGILSPSPYDLNNDHKINALDLAVVEDNQGNGTDPNRDWDQDGWSVAENDCDDRDFNKNPMFVESENGKDDNCNGDIDEFVHLEPIESNHVVTLAINYTRNNQGVIDLGLQSVSRSDVAQPITGSRAMGGFPITLRGEDGKIWDQLYFSPYDFDLFSAQQANSGTVNIVFPINDFTTSIEVYNPTNPGNQLTIAVNDISTNRASDSADDACSGSLNELFDSCQNLGDDASKVQSAAGSILSKAPQLQQYQIPALVIEDDNFGLFLGLRSNDVVVGRHYVNDLPANQLAILMYGAIQTQIWNTLKIASSGGGGQSDHWKLFIKNLNAYGRSLEAANCRSHDPHCSFNPAEFVPKFEEAHPILNAYELSTIGIPGLEIQINLPHWKDEYLNNPKTGEEDAYGPRPQGGIGLLSVTGNSTPYRFATLMAGDFMDKSKVDSFVVLSDEGLLSIVLDGDIEGYGARKILTGAEKYTETSGLTKGYIPLGEGALVKDWDHDGVSDLFDNCSAEVYPRTCNIPDDPNERSKCYNPDQTDSDNDKVGDQCEFGGNGLGSWVACGSNDSDSFFYNSPVLPDAWDCRGLHLCGGDPVWAADYFANQIDPLRNTTPCTRRGVQCSSDNTVCWYVEGDQNH
jgi:hypothetical protein